MYYVKNTLTNEIMYKSESYANVLDKYQWYKKNTRHNNITMIIGFNANLK